MKRRTLCCSVCNGMRVNVYVKGNVRAECLNPDCKHKGYTESYYAKHPEERPKEFTAQQKNSVHYDYF